MITNVLFLFCFDLNCRAMKLIRRLFGDMRDGHFS